jgi:hypothetical protein
MLLGGIFLLIVGAGCCSFDALLGGCCRSTPPPDPRKDE